MIRTYKHQYLSLSSILSFFVFFLIYVFPGALQIIKAPVFLLIIVLSVFVYSLKNKPGLSSIVITLCLIYLSKGIWGILIGIIKDAQGVYNLIPISIYWVVLYIIFTSLLNTKHSIKSVILSIIIGTFIISIIDIFFVLQFLKLIPSELNIFSFYYSIYEPFDYSFSFGYSGGKTIEFIAYNINNFFFCFPLLLCLLLSSDSLNKSFWTKKIVLFILILLCCVIIIFSNRRMLLIIALISPFIIYGISFFMSKKSRAKPQKYLIRICAGVLFFAIVFLAIFSKNLNIDFERIYYELSELTNESKNPRYRQAELLIQHWKKAPIEGHGIGATLPYYFKKKKTPWAFELSYHLHLMQLGVIGLILELIFYFGILILGLIQLSKTNDIILLGLLTGYICFMIANATNPYTSSFDFLWPLFLPLAYINYLLIHSKKK